MNISLIQNAHFVHLKTTHTLSLSFFINTLTKYFSLLFLLEITHSEFIRFLILFSNLKSWQWIYFFILQNDGSYDDDDDDENI